MYQSLILRLGVSSVDSAPTTTTTAESGDATDVRFCGSVSYDTKRYYCQHGTYAALLYVELH